jgi:hypothetical protein
VPRIKYFFFFLEEPEVQKVMLSRGALENLHASNSQSFLATHNHSISLFKVLLIYYLHKDAVSGCDYTASNKIISEKQTGKKKCHQLDVGYVEVRARYLLQGTTEYD